MHPPLSDEQRAALDIDRHLAVVANAGSGKTRVLTYRFVWLVVEHRVDLESVVAITFTTKAAAEMRERIRTLIGELLDSSELRHAVGFTHSDADVVKRLKQLRRTLADARIATFHSFCAGILRMFGHEQGIDPEAVELTERDATTMRDRATRMAIRAYMEDHRNDLLNIYESLDFSAFEAAVASLARSSERFLLLEQLHGRDSSPTQQCARARQAALQVLGNMCVSLADSAIAFAQSTTEHRSDDTQNYITKLQAIRTALQTSTDGPRADTFSSLYDALLKVFTKQGPARKKEAYPGSSDAAPIDKKVFDLLAVLSKGLDPAQDEVQAQIAWHAARIAENSHEKYATDKRQRNAIDFDDMMSGVVNLLETHPRVAAYISSGISHLMVDEYQDTNPTQYRLMQLIVPQLEDPTVVPGPRVFVVGDDKQSIYGFRDADVRLFRRTVADMETINKREGALAETLLTIATSYRMAEPLARSVNSICQGVFTQESTYDVPYAPLACGRPAQPPSIGTLSTIVTDVQNEDLEFDTDDSTSDRELRHIVWQVVNMLHNGSVMVFDADQKDVRPVRPGDIAILARRTASVSTLASMLHSARVPYQVFGGRAFFSRPEVADIRNLLSVAVDPSHPIALAAVLRSPIFRLTDEELTEIAFHGSSHGFGWEALLERAASTEGSPAMRSAVDVLQTLRTDLKQGYPTKAIRAALLATQWHATIFEHPRCDQIIANVEKTLDIIRSASETPGASLRDVLDAIALPTNADREAESSFSNDRHSVQVMTIHAAKGLEFPVVIMCDLNGGGQHQTYTLTDSVGLTLSLGKHTMLVDGIKPQPIDPGIVAEANAVIHAQRDSAELKRLLYVALTRGKDHVFVSMQRRYNKPDSKTGEMVLRKASGIAGILQPLLLEEIRFPMLDSPPATRTYDAHLGPFQYIDRTDTIPWRPVPETLSVTALLGDHEGGSSGASDTTVALTLGTIVHDTLEILTRDHYQASSAEIATMLQAHPLSSNELALLAQPHVERVLHSSLWPTVAGVDSEKSIGAMLDDTLLYGRIDAMRHDEDHASIWDWKTNAVTESTVAAVADHYAIQMQAYAWMVLSTTDASSVTTRLVFTALLETHYGQAVVERTFTRAELNTLTEQLRIVAFA